MSAPGRRLLAVTTAVLLVSGMVPTPLHAADRGGNYAIWGSGARSCHQFRKSADDAAARAPFRHYLMGYLTAYNTLADNTYNALGTTTLDQAEAWISDYCGNHQMDSFNRAVEQLVTAHYEQRQQTPRGDEKSWGRSPSKNTAAP